MFTRRFFVSAAASGTIVAAATGAAAQQEKSIVVSSTTSTQDSGLFGHILPLFKQKTGIDVKVVAQGTGQALDTGRRGDADVVFVHSKSAEEKFLAEGEGVKRFPVMYNDFVLIGPKSDPAGIKGMKDVAKALQTIKEKQAPFISRGDRSGTHIAELSIWNKDADIDIEKDTNDDANLGIYSKMWEIVANLGEVEVDKEYDQSLRGWEVTIVGRWGRTEYDDNFGREGVFDSALPTS